MLYSEPLPPYSYVPGGPWPHPISSPQGHSFGQAASKVAALSENQGANSSRFLRGVCLFNAGYYWEAHEVWEGLWHAYGRRGVLADVIKALIKLAAAGVKVREGQEHGVRTSCPPRRRIICIGTDRGIEPSTGFEPRRVGRTIATYRGSTAGRSGAVRHSRRAGLRVSDRDRSERFSTLITLNRGDSRGLSQWYVLARRKPWVENRYAGGYPLRSAERRYAGGGAQRPAPNNTRASYIHIIIICIYIVFRLIES